MPSIRPFLIILPLLLALALTACGAAAPSEDRSDTDRDDPRSSSDRNEPGALPTASNDPPDSEPSSDRNAPINEWWGVGTGDSGPVTQLSLQRSELTGEIPPELGNLSSLTSLDLGGNQFSGCVPTRLQGKLNMKYSDLGSLSFCQ